MVLGEAGPRALDVGFCRVRVSKGSAKKGAFIVRLGFGDFLSYTCLGMISIAKSYLGVSANRGS